MFKINQSGNAVVGTVLASFILVAAGSAMAEETQWQKDHPRRAEVNQRLKNQDQRIKQEVKTGEITRTQGQVLHKEDRQIRQEERDMAKQSGGHITKGEKKVLNQQENAVSKEIGK
jgi:hypothetical protein